MSRRNTDTITIHQHFDWIENNPLNRRSRWKKCLSVQVTQMAPATDVQKETGHSLRSIHSAAVNDGNSAKLKKRVTSPFFIWQSVTGFESQPDADPDIQNYFDVPPHKYRMTNMQCESRYFFHSINVIANRQLTT